MGSIRDIHNVWRDNLVPASFRGAVFHVETSTRASGRRTVVHQYPKRNIPYSEDMGREAVKWSFTAYLILRDKGLPGNLLTQIADLIYSLESDEAGMLIHPTLGAMLCMCERYSYSDQRMKGGYVEFEMQFVEAGSPVMAMALMDASGMLSQSADGAEAGAVSSINSGTASLQGSKPLGQGGIGSA
jgi:prophage DNA circulation protein